MENDFKTLNESIKEVEEPIEESSPCFARKNLQEPCRETSDSHPFSMAKDNYEDDIDINQLK